MSELLQQTAGFVTGTVTGAGPDGAPLVRWREDGRPRAARCVWLATAPDWAACRGLRVALAFEAGDEERPLVLGLLDAPPAAALPRVLRLQGQDEVVLECGKARVALRADGQVTILGGQIVSRASGANKIKGGSVQIN